MRTMNAANRFQDYEGARSSFPQHMVAWQCAALSYVSIMHGPYQFDAFGAPRRIHLLKQCRFHRDLRRLQWNNARVPALFISRHWP